MIDTREIATAKIVMLGGNGGGGGTSNYNQLTNKPSINRVTLQGNKTSSDLHIDGMPENPLATSHGGTGNADGYIRKGVAQGSTVGNGATAEGYGNTVSGDYSHAEGSGNTASSYHSHAEGSTNTASAPQAHAQGYGTIASGAHSHAGGAYTVAGYANQTAIGEYNDNKATTLLEVGNGTADNARSNAFEVHSNGNIVAGGTVSDANGTLNAVVGNPSDTVSSIIDKIKIGARTYDTSAIKPYTATNITTSAISISIGLAEASTLNGRIIAVNTGSRSGTPSNAWGLNILYNGGGSSVGCAILKSDGTTFKDAVTANEVLFLSMDMTNLEATIVNIAGTSGGGVATSVVGTVESGTTASQAYAVGEHFIRNDKFCTAIASIASGATLTQGTNYVEGTIADNINYHVYSATERVVGRWVDGKDIFEKTYDFGPINTNSSYDVLISNLNTVIKVYGLSGEGTPVPYLDTAGAQGFVGWFKFAGGVCITTGRTRSLSAGKVTIQYTKSSS